MVALRWRVQWWDRLTYQRSRTDSVENSCLIFANVTRTLPAVVHPCEDSPSFSLGQRTSRWA